MIAVIILIGRFEVRDAVFEVAEVVDTGLSPSRS